MESPSSIGRGVPVGEIGSPEGAYTYVHLGTAVYIDKFGCIINPDDRRAPPPPKFHRIHHPSRMADRAMSEIRLWRFPTSTTPLLPTPLPRMVYREGYHGTWGLRGI